MNIQPEKNVNLFLQKKSNGQKINVFVERFEIHPAMIIGRFQHKKTIPYYFGKHFLFRLI